MSDTSIEWTDVTWNPIRGCSRVSEGCRNCYAERVAARFSGPGRPYEGLARVTATGPRWTGNVRLIENALYEPVSWRKPRRVFVNSMSDLFHEGLTAGEISDVFDIMGTCRRHTYQVLTKRPERMRAFLSGFAPTGLPAWPWPHVHLGVSVEDQATADERIPILLQTPAAVRWVSYEPALGPVDFIRGGFSFLERLTSPSGQRYERLDWIVVGGESGPGARPFDVAWARSTVAQCRAAGVPVFVKQLGALPYDHVGYQDEPLLYRSARPSRYWPEYDGSPVLVADAPLQDPKGGDMAEWPEDLRVREWPA